MDGDRPRADFAGIPEPLIRAHASRIEALARRHAHRHLPAAGKDDLAQIGYMALMETFVRFQPERGVPFAGYAHRRLRGAIMDAVRVESRQSHGDMAASIPAERSAEEMMDLRRLEAQDREPPERQHYRAELRERLRRAIGFLEPRERLLVGLLYFGQMTMKEAGAKLGISEGRVSQLHKEILPELRRVLEAMGIRKASDAAFE